MNYARRLLASILLTVVAVTTLALPTAAAEAIDCVGVDLTVTVLGQPYPLLTNACSRCFIYQGENDVGVNPFGIGETSVQTFECFDP